LAQVLLDEVKSVKKALNTTKQFLSKMSFCQTYLTL